MQQLGIQSEILQQIIDGRKTVEGRLGKDKFLTIKPGDTISIREDIYKDGNIAASIEDQARITIDAVEPYDSFEAMLRAVGYEKAIPSARSLEDALAQYRVYYSEADERQYGVIALHFHSCEIEV